MFGHLLLKYSWNFIGQKDLDFCFFFQIINYDSPRGGVTVVTNKGETTTSFLLIKTARPSDSGQYQCNPSNSKSKGVTVHVLNGKYNKRESKWKPLNLNTKKAKSFEFLLLKHFNFYFANKYCFKTIFFSSSLDEIFYFYKEILRMGGWPNNSTLLFNFRNLLLQSK